MERTGVVNAMEGYDRDDRNSIPTGKELKLTGGKLDYHMTPLSFVLIRIIADMNE